MTGKKIGVTSKAVQDMLGVFQPDFGFLTDRMQVADGTTVSLAGAGLIQPAPRARSPSCWPPTCRARGHARAGAGRHRLGRALLRDRRFAHPRLEDPHPGHGGRQRVPAASSSSARSTPTRGLDLAAARRCGHVEERRALRQRQRRRGAGHPAEAVAWLANTLGAFGIAFRAGELILSGSLRPLVPVAAGDRFTMEIEGLGGCSIAFSE